MKDAKRLIPTPPTPPSPPRPPSPSIPPTPTSSPASAQKITQGGIPGMITEIMKKIGGGKGKGPSPETIQRWIKEFPLDKYRDENGKVCCPVPKEYRDKLMKRLKGLD